MGIFRKTLQRHGASCRIPNQALQSKARFIKLCTSFGSSRSESEVNPETSTMRTVTCLRSPSMALREGLQEK